ncbi:hypothetical protein RJ639_010921 [Escallonia herrerae]|uniref:Reverse transcriptase Ty1/copia-type domain-containing protein n=1 Tax=Escallonia herrerae TaxID=1293975 RepID=A0AA89AS72_9ASTE|nr:hypothetical protein RJ639_010921 [Escallonia herrerae]
MKAMNRMLCPLTFEEASQEAKWRKAMEDEINAIDRNKTWKFTTLPKGHKAIGVKWVFKTKRNAQGEVEKHKARCPYEHALYVKNNPQGDVLFVCLYVDDLIFTSNNPSMIDEFKQSMVKEFDMTDMGLMAYFLGIEVKQGSNEIFISQSKYAAEILKKFAIEDCQLVDIPVECGTKLTKKGAGKPVNPTYYKSLVGCLRYLTCTRHDLLFGVGLVSRYMENPRTSHLQAAKRILKYVKVTSSYGLFYPSSQNLELAGSDRLAVIVKVRGGIVGFSSLNPNLADP